MANVSQYQKILEIQEFVVSRHNRLNMELNVGAENIHYADILGYFANTVLVEALYDGVYKVIDQLLAAPDTITEYSITMILAFLVSQLVMANALNESLTIPAGSIQSIQTEIHWLIEYLTSNYTGRNVLPTF